MMVTENEIHGSFYMASELNKDPLNYLDEETVRKIMLDDYAKYIYKWSPIVPGVL